MNRFWARNDTDENSSDNEDTERDDRQNIPFDDSDVD